MKKCFLISLITFIFCLGYVPAQDIKERSYKEVGDDFLDCYCDFDSKGMLGMLDELNINNIEYVLWLLEKYERKFRKGDLFPFEILDNCENKEDAFTILDKFVFLLNKIANENDSIDITREIKRYEIEKSKYLATQGILERWRIKYDASAPVYKIFKIIGTRTNPEIVNEADRIAKVRHQKNLIFLIIYCIVMILPIGFIFYKYKDKTEEKNIRLEERNDYREVENLVRESYWNVKQPGCTMHFLVNQCRLSTDFIPELDFLMERIYSKNKSSEKEIYTIGHIMFSEAKLVLGNGVTEDVLLLVTICIDSKYRKHGYSSKLLNCSLDKARTLGAGLIFVIGDVEFFKSAGFDYAQKVNIHCENYSEGSDSDELLFLEIIPDWLKSNSVTSGSLVLPDFFAAADDNEEAFNAYEATFPKKEMMFLPTQNLLYCQSCGRLLTKVEECGTYKDGNVNTKYCKRCYQKGNFTKECTMEEMIAYQKRFLDEYNSYIPNPITKEEYEQILRFTLPSLKRWKPTDNKL